MLWSAPAFGEALFGDSLRDVLDPKLRATLTATGCARNEWGLFDSRLQDVRDPLAEFPVSSTKAIQQTGISGNE